LAFYIGEHLLVVIPEGFAFGSDSFTDSVSPPGGPPPPGSGSIVSRPDDWVDPPFADDVRILLEVARARTSLWRSTPDLQEQVRSYIDLAMSVLYGAVDPADVQPSSLTELKELEERLNASLEACKKLRSTLGGPASAR